MDFDPSGAPGNPLWEGLDKPDTQASAAPAAPAAPMPEPRAPTGPKDDTSSLSEFLNSADPEQTSAGGTFARGVALGAAPAVTGLGGAGAGAYIGGAVGLLGGPLAEFTVPAGAFVGGLAGGIGGGYVGSETQNYALSQMPETAEKLGISERQQQLMANEHGTALFMGGLVPMALTMKPGGFARGAVPEGATTFQQLMASPVTARLMGGGIMGGIELGQELAGGQSPDWVKIGISTGFGVIFNKPNRIGEALIGAGERPLRAMLPGLGERTSAAMHPEAAPTPEPPLAKEGGLPLAEVPPPAAGYVRFFHGGEEPTTGGGRLVTVDPERAAADNKPVWYVDVPVGHDVERGARNWGQLDEDFRTGNVGTYQHMEIPEEFAKQMKPYPMPAPAEPGTVIQAADTGVLGPGITEQTYMGNQARDPAAAQSAQDMARTEDLLLGRSAKTEADVQRIARQMEPELFQRYDEALQRYEGLKRWIADYNSPPPDVINAAVAKVNTLQAQLEQHVTSQNGYSGGHEARRLRAHLRDAQRELQTIRDRGQAFAEGRAEPAPEREAARQHMLAADIEMRDMAAEVSAALRRAAEAGGSEVVPAKGEDALEAEAPPAAPAEPPIMPASEVIAETAAAPKPLAEQHAAIVDDVKARLIAAGRPEAEAQAHAEIIAAYYETRAARFKGALGTAEELYRREAPAIRGGKGVVPGSTTPPAAEPAPRLPAVIRALAEPPAAPAVEALAPLVPTEEKPALPPTNPAVAGPGGGIEAIDPTTISVDASRFQFKAGGDESGVTERLHGVEKWDPRLAGTALVFRDAEGKDWIADGHQRLALAKRLSEGQPGIRINAFVLKEGDGVTDAEARVIAAIKNIAEGTGTSIDAAKILREAGESGVEMPPLPPKSVLVREGRDLSKLSSDAFGMAVNGVVPTNQAAVVGRMVADPAVQVEAMRVLAKSQPDNMRQAEMIVRELLETGTEEGTQQSLFGDEHFASSIVLERAKIADEALRQLARDRTTFRTLVSEADRITSLGQNALDAEANKSRLTSDEQAQQLLTALAFRKGEISDALSDVSRRYKDGSISRAEASRQFLEAVRRKIESGLDEGPDLGRSLLGAEPDQQSLTLFQAAYHGSPHVFDRFEMAKIGTGEGAQAYGHGLYFAGNKEVAQYYRDALSQPEVTIAGLPANEFRQLSAATHDRNKAITDGMNLHWPEEFKADGNAADLDRAVQFMAPTTIARLAGEISGDIVTGKSPRQALDNIASDARRDFAAATDKRDQAVAATRLALSEALRDKIEASGQGRLYHVELAPKAEEYLDWDKPIGQQNEKVRQFFGEPKAPPAIADAQLRSIIKRALRESDGNAHDVAMVVDNDQGLYNAAMLFAKSDKVARQKIDDGELSPGDYVASKAAAHLKALEEASAPLGQIYKQRERQVGPAEFSRQLHEAGIPGVRYFDQFSRDQGEGAHNYVLFSDDLVQIQHYEQGAQGTIRLTPGKRSVITLMGSADASTFMHESGHQFLEDLMTDAGHDAAPADLQADATTVRNWLGIGEDGKIRTAQHEKFARGFEQYLREGRAPSQALARVFSQFRDWLVSIYRTMKGLGAPITDDVRGVFDRMLATEPQHTVIAPEQARQPSLADIHRTDAAETEPHEAEPVMDRVISERDRYIQDQPPEIQREVQAAFVEVKNAADNAGNAGAEDGAGAVGLPDVGEGGGAPGIKPEGGAGGAGHGDELGGGGPARAEGPGVSRIPDGADINRPKPNPPGSVAPAAAPRVGPDAPNPVADKAGNIRLDLLTDMQDLSAEKIRDVIRQAADQNEEFIGDRRGVVTDGMAMDLANDLGMEGAWRLVRNRVKGQAFNAEQIMVLSKLLVTSASSVSEASTKAASGAPGDILAYAIAKERHTMIQATVAAGTAEAGRALRAFQLLKKYNAGAGAEGAEQAIRDATGRTLNQLRVEARLAAQLDTPQKVSKFLRDNQNRSLGRMVLEVWINGLISGVATHSTYSVGNTLTSILSAGPETAVAAGIGAVRQALGRGGDRAFISEVPAKFKGAFEGLPSAVKASFGAMRTGVTTLLPGESLRNLPPGVKRALREHAANLNQPSMLPGSGTQPDTMPFQPGSELVQPDVMTPGVQYRDAVSGAMGVVQGIKDGIIAGAALVKAGGVAGEPLLTTQYSPLGYVPDVNVHGVTVPIGSTIRLPGRFIAAIHSFFRSMNYSMEINALSTRVAIGEGLTGVARDARIASLRQSPPEEMMAAARGQATELTLMNHANEWMRKLGDLTNAAVNLPVLGETPVLKFVDPFVQIAANVTAQGPGKRSVLGLMSSEIRADLMGKNGNIAADRTLARMLVGTALSIGIGSLAAKKLVNGSGPSDPKESAMWRMAGNQPHSVRIGDTWYNVGRLGPLGMLMGISADMYDVAHTAEKGDMLTAAAHLQHAFTQNILDESFMRGPAELIQAVEDPGRYGENYLKNFVSSFVPFSVGMAQMARAADPYSRQARTVMDAIKNKVPGLSEELMPRRDVFGEPLPNLPSLGGRAISAIYMSQVNNDPVVQAFNQLGIFPANVDKKIRGIELTPQQFDDFQRIGGRLMKQRLDALVASQAYQTLPPYVKHNVLKEYVSQSREAARGMLMAKYPQIARDAYDLKIQTRTDFQESDDF